MSRRQYDIRFKCAEEGCREHYWSTASTRKEERETRSHYAKHPWRCTRHRKPEEVLSASNRERTTILTAGKSKQFPELPDLFWDDGSGFEFGPGFKAYARDFPPGTRLIITARIELPEADQ